MKEDERKFLIDVYQKCKERIRPRRLIEEPDFYMNHKRAWRILEKWDAKGWYEYGVTLDLGVVNGRRESKSGGINKGNSIKGAETNESMDQWNSNDNKLDSSWDINFDNYQMR